MFHRLATTVRNFVSPDQFEVVQKLPCYALLPGDLLLLVASYLSASDLVNAVQTCKHYYTNIIPALYSTVTIKSAEQCSITLGMLSRRADVARHVTALLIKLGRTPDAAEQRVVCATAVRNLAVSGTLDALSRFDWNAEEIPPHDDMWAALKIGCPRLKHVGLSLGFHLPGLSSHIFNFSDLEGFSLTFKQRFYSNYGEMFLQDDLPVLQAFWDLLSEKSPNLQELAITGESTTSDIVVIKNLMKKKWPELRKFTLGDVCIDPPFVPSPTSADPVHPFIAFIEGHSQLKSLSLSRHNVPIACFNSLSPGALPHVTEFIGTLEQLQSLPQIHGTLRSVKFSDSMRTREFTPPAVVAALQNLPNLADLEISLILNSVYDSNSLLRGIVQGCPHLQRLSMTCTEKPSFQVESFARAIRALSRLEQLELTIVQYPGDDSISLGAARIAQNNPHLHSFSLTFLPTAPPLRLPFSIPYLSMPSPVNEAGQYTVTCDKHGRPQFLAAVEQRRRPWPWSSRSSTKRHTDDLRPAGYPGKVHINSFVGLMFERSQAGEEMRMMMFSLGLVTLAMWGFLGAMAIGAA